VAALALAKSTRPDGYSFMIGSNGPLTVNPSIQPNLGYDPLQDFAFVGLACRTPQTVVVKAALPVRSLAEFIAYGRSRPGAVTVGSSGVGSTAHLALETFNSLTGLQLQHVPFGSGGAMAPNLIAGNIDAAVTEVSTSLPLHRAGQARILAIAAARRSGLAPDIPTAEEAGVAGFREAAFLGLVLPAGPEPAVRDRLAQALAAALALPETRRRLAEVGSEVAEPSEQTPAGFARFVTEELARTKAAAVRAGLRAG
jgi:tripartite-type tricarboxylate transporter receptor subunit TctC